MKQWLTERLYRFQMWMVGRYGNDELTRFLSIISIVLLVLSWLFYPLYPVALGLMIWSLTRTFSKNIPARSRERDAYLRISGKARTKGRLLKRMWRERKTHRYFKCKQCRAVIRIPKGRGDLDVGCPRCGTRTVKHT